jgi:membrane protein DedA with SNARE-associated domain
MPFRVFIFYDGMAALLSVPLLCGAIYYFGNHVDRVIKIARSVQNGIVFLIIGVVALLVIKHYAPHAIKRKKHRR